MAMRSPSSRRGRRFEGRSSSAASGDGGFASPERARRRRRMAQRGLSPSSQTRARRQAQRLRGVEVTDAQLMEEALLEAVQRQLCQAAPARAASAAASSCAAKCRAKSERSDRQVRRSAAGAASGHAEPQAAACTRRGEQPISPEAVVLRAGGRRHGPLPDEETDPEAGYSSSDGSDSAGRPPGPDARTAPARRRQVRVWHSSIRPRRAGRGSRSGGRLPPKADVRRPSTSEGVRTFGRPSTSEGCRTFGRPSTSDGPRGASPSRDGGQ